MLLSSNAAAPRRREFYAGALVALLGAGAAFEGWTYAFGSLLQMGPGFMPTVLGIALIIVGISIAAAGPPDAEDAHDAMPPIDWRGASCIFGGVLAFILLGMYAGFAAASFACVFIAAMGDRTATFLTSAMLAAGVTAAGIGLFIYVLNIPFPLFGGLQ